VGPRRLAVIGLAVALVGAATVLVVVYQSPTRAHSISVDPGIGEYFVPVPAGMFSTPVTAAEAYARLNGRPAPIPQHVTVRHGLLTMPRGPNGHGGLSYRYRDRPVWAFTTPACIRMARPQLMSDRAAAPCQTWQFIDARTAQDLGGVG
jgi:hypothetical protein